MMSLGLKKDGAFKFVVAECRTHGIPLPGFCEIHGEFCVTFKNRISRNTLTKRLHQGA